MTPCCNTLGKTVETANLVGKTERLKIAPSKTLANVCFCLALPNCVAVRFLEIRFSIELSSSSPIKTRISPYLSMPKKNASTLSKAVSYLSCLFTTGGHVHVD